MRRTTQPPEGADPSASESKTLPVLGFVYQLSQVHAVSLKVAPQVVLRLLCTAQWTPEETWSSLLRGKHHLMKAELIRLLQQHHPSHATSIYDAWRLEQQGKIMSCCVRITTTVSSGDFRPFMAVRPPTVHSSSRIFPLCGMWNHAWPTTLEPLLCSLPGRRSSVLSVGRPTYWASDARGAQEEGVRAALGAVSKVTWILSGVPVAFSGPEANSILQEMGVGTSVLEHTRRVQRTTQSWTVHLKPSESPREDTIHVSRAGRDYFCHAHTI